MSSDTCLRLPDKRSVNFRWLAGSILTGITSVVLMGGALFAAIDARHDIAQPTGLLTGSPLQKGASIPQSSSFSSGKSDRFSPLPKQESARRILYVPTVQKEGDRDFIREKPFVHIRAPLALETNRLIESIPEFNPLAVYTEDQSEPAQSEFPTISTTQVEGEISIQVRDFPLAMGAVDVSIQMDEKEVRADILEIARFINGDEANLLAQAPLGADGIMLPHVEILPEEAALQPAAAYSITITPENVSFIQKFEESDNQGFSYEERIAIVHEGETLSKILRTHEANEVEIAQAVEAMRQSHDISELKAGQKIRIAMASAEDGTDRLQPARISLYEEDSHIASIAMDDDGRFVRAAEPYLKPDFAQLGEPVSLPSQLPTLYDSLYQTGLSLEMPPALVSDIIRIFSYEVDFQKPITPNDSMIVLHTLPEEAVKNEAHILFSEITLAGNTKQFYRFRTPDDGYVDYYDASGRSAKKFLMRKPLAAGHFNSPFGMRRHPITGVYKMHAGVDWAAPRGTPIYAAGNGTIVMAKWNSTYGRHIRIQHANRYETSYSHLSKFAPGIKASVRVRQGQLIGYVGSTGFSTGPHLHYEVLVNKRRVDPMRIKLPRGRVLKGEMLALFQEERSRIDALLRQETETQIASTN